jgi:hypothetical protein
MIEKTATYFNIRHLGYTLHIFKIRNCNTVYNSRHKTIDPLG